MSIVVLATLTGPGSAVPPASAEASGPGGVVRRTGSPTPPTPAPETGLEA